MKKAIDVSALDVVLENMTKLIQQIQYYTAFYEALPELYRKDYDFLELHTAFGNNICINPDYIRALREAEGDKGSAVMIGDEWYYTFSSYDVMKENINNCYEWYRKAYGEAKQQIKEIKKGNNG